MNKLKSKVYDFIMDVKDPLYNFNLGKIYDDQGQWSSAVSYYLRAAEYSEGNLLSYESLLKISSCLQKQNNRLSSCKSLLFRAISLMPKRPEAYWLMATLCENTKDWHQCYAMSCLGETLEESKDPLITDVGFPGIEAFTFERAVSAWWIGLYDESIHLFRKIIQRSTLPAYFIQICQNNINNLAGYAKRPTNYDRNSYNKLRYKFPGAEKIEKNYSEAHQDMFVLSMLNGKQNGKYIEIGCADPFFYNNTFLLEKDFNWTGISIDIDFEQIKKYVGERKTKTLHADALKIDYEKLLTDSTYDYLQVDCEPPMTTFRILQKIPLHRVKFAVITFEHDNYISDNKEIKEKSRKYLESFGYILTVSNISKDKYSDFEDWYVHPDLVDEKIIKQMISISDQTKRSDDYILGKI